MSGAARNRRFGGGNPGRRVLGWGAVVLVHLLAGWALVSGTSRRQLEALRNPMAAAVIQEVTIAPPPPAPAPAPAREIRQPQRELVRPPAPAPAAPAPQPPPQLQPAPPAATAPIPAPPPAAPQLAAPAPPAAPQMAAPAPAAAAATAPAAPPRSATAPSAAADMAVACPKQVPPEMPRKALREGTEGVVKAQALIRDGAVREVTILSGPRVFHAAVRGAMLQYQCVSGPGEVLVTQDFTFKIEQ